MPTPVYPPDIAFSEIETTMFKSPTILSRRSMFQAGAGLIASAAASPLLAPGTAQAEETQPATQAPLNGNGFYRFKIGEFPRHGDLRRLRRHPGRPHPRHEHARSGTGPVPLATEPER